MIGNDRTNGEIARELGYSIPTIKKDLQQIMRILGTEDRRATAGRAREIGLLPERRQRD
jgi:DNA-binding CsgD family transcriptional regulator